MKFDQLYDVLKDEANSVHPIARWVYDKTIGFYICIDIAKFTAYIGTSAINWQQTLRRNQFDNVTALSPYLREFYWCARHGFLTPSCSKRQYRALSQLVIKSNYKKIPTKRSITIRLKRMESDYKQDLKEYPELFLISDVPVDDGIKMEGDISEDTYGWFDEINKEISSARIENISTEAIPDNMIFDHYTGSIRSRCSFDEC